MTLLNKVPMLLIGVLALLGFLTPLEPAVILLVIFIISYSPFFPKRGKRACAVGASLYFLGALMSFIMLPSFEEEELKGTFHFAIDQIKDTKTAFGKGVVYQGHIVSINTPKKRLNHCKLPCTICMNKKNNLTHDLVAIDGTLTLKTRISSRLKPSPKTAWGPVGTTSFAEKRYFLKQTLQKIIEDKFSYSDTKSLIAGLVTGNFDDFLVSQEFSRLGLSHLMAISGFHFSLIANILGLLCVNFFKRKTATLLLMTFLSTYFLFLGASASVLRAWTMIVIALGEHFVEKRGEPLNSLGASIVLLLIVSPTEVLKPAFWLSYGITASILLFSSPCQKVLTLIFKERQPKEIKRLTPLNQWGYFALTLLKKAMSLNLAVTIFALPLTLFFFHKFPWISLFANLLFPPLVGVSLLLFLLGIILFPIGKSIDFINDIYTHILLSFMTNLPLKINFVWRVPSMEIETLIVVLLPLLLCGLYLQSTNRSSKFYL